VKENMHTLADNNDRIPCLESKELVFFANAERQLHMQVLRWALLVKKRRTCTQHVEELHEGRHVKAGEHVG
jgi:hypothetical protein